MFDIRKSLPEESPVLIKIWKEAVQATHHFLDREYFLFILEKLPVYLAACDVYVLERESGKIAGFTAVSSQKLEMLFVAERGKGIGSKLLRFAINELGAKQVDVNEQNEQALSFYLGSGFMVRSRSATDSEGRPYPILHLELA